MCYHVVIYCTAKLTVCIRPKGSAQRGRIWLPESLSRGDPFPVQKEKVCVTFYCLYCIREHGHGISQSYNL